MSVHNLSSISIDLDALACQHGQGEIHPGRPEGCPTCMLILTLKGAPFLRMLVLNVAGDALSERLMKTGCKSHWSLLVDRRSWLTHATA